VPCQGDRRSAVTHDHQSLSWLCKYRAGISARSSTKWIKVGFGLLIIFSIFNHKHRIFFMNLKILLAQPKFAPSPGAGGKLFIFMVMGALYWVPIWAGGACTGGACTACSGESMRFISVLVAGALSPLYEEAKTSASGANAHKVWGKRRRRNLSVIT
jgi:hypothetical protein